MLSAAPMRPRNKLAQPLSPLLFALAASLALAGCPGMHGRPDDAGVDSRIPPTADAGPGADVSPGLDAPGSDAGGAPSCDAEDAVAETCASLCDGPPSWHWNGDRCVSIDCGACRGTSCAGAPRSESECLSAHAGCEASLCRATGGEWLWWAEECGHYECGRPVPAICEVGFPVCDCGPARRFVAGEGCVTDGLCEEPPPATPEMLCTTTGGTWGGFCCHSECGVPCADDCTAPACNCGPTEIFDPARGCRDATECHEPGIGQPCEGRARCPSGAICCQHCGGAGCFGPPTCEIPICDSDPTIDECGNDLLAP